MKYKLAPPLLAALLTTYASREVLAQAPSKPAIVADVDNIVTTAIEKTAIKTAEATAAVIAAKESEVVDEKLKAREQIDREKLFRERIRDIDVAIKRSKAAFEAGRFAPAKSEIHRAEDKLDEAKDLAALLSDRERSVVTAKAEEVKAQVAAIEDGAKGCNGALYCLFAGVFMANYSLTSMWLSPRSGQSGHHIVALVVPTAGFRYAFHPSISLDASLYTALLSQELKLNTVDGKNNGCRKGGGELEDRLPCEGNAEGRPYGALNVGLTFGSESLGLISPGLTFGLARTAQDPNAKPFFGFLLGLGQVFTTIKLGR